MTRFQLIMVEITILTLACLLPLWSFFKYDTIINSGASVSILNGTASGVASPEKRSVDRARAHVQQFLYNWYTWDKFTCSSRLVEALTFLDRDLYNIALSDARLIVENAELSDKSSSIQMKVVEAEELVDTKGVGYFRICIESRVQVYYGPSPHPMIKWTKEFLVVPLYNGDHEFSIRSIVSL